MTHKSQTSSRHFCHFTGRGEEGKGGEKCKLFTLRCCLQKQNICFHMKKFIPHATELLWRTFASPSSPFIFLHLLNGQLERPKQHARRGHTRSTVKISICEEHFLSMWLLQALGNVISYFMKIRHNITFHMVKLAIPHWITMNLNKASMLPVLLYENPFSQHHPHLSDIR